MKKYTNIMDEKLSKDKAITILSQDDFYNILKDNCTQFSFDDPAIYRDINLDDVIYCYANPDIPFSKNYYEHDGRKIRKSAYTSNHYNLLLNHLPSWKEYPKRQVICSTISSAGFNNYNKFRLIPFDGVKIGVTHSYDIQDTIFGTILSNVFDIGSLTKLNKIYNDNNIDDSDWIKFAENMERKYYDTEENIYNIDYLNDIMSPKNMGFKLLDYNQFIKDDKIHNIRKEVWIDNEHLLIRLSEIDNFRSKFNI